MATDFDTILKDELETIAFWILCWPKNCMLRCLYLDPLSYGTYQLIRNRILMQGGSKLRAMTNKSCVVLKIYRTVYRIHNSHAFLI